MIGVLVYWVGRLPGSAYFLEKAALPRLNNSGIPLVNQLPDFLHPFGFTLLSIGLFARNRRERLALAISWLVIDLSLELSQKYGSRISAYIPSWFDHIPVFSNTKSYFANGTFDPLDLLAICFGVTAAYLVSGLTKQTCFGVKCSKQYLHGKQGGKKWRR